MGGGEGVFFSPQWHGTDRSCGGYKPWKFVWQSKSGAWDVELQGIELQGVGRRLGLLLFRLRPVDGHRAWLRLVWLDWAK